MNPFCGPTVTVFFEKNLGNMVESIACIVSIMAKCKSMYFVM